MKQFNLMNVNKGLVLVGLLAIAAVLAIVSQSPASGQYSSSDLLAPAEKSSALQLIEGSNAGQATKQPPGLVGKPQNHTAPPETVPPRPAPPMVQPPVSDPPIVVPPVIKPKVPYCPQYNYGSDSTDDLYPCDPCVRPLTPDGTGPCLAP
jgi:hypothetical protein